MEIIRKIKRNTQKMGEVKNQQNLICVPGQRLCLSDENTVTGQGTYERQGYIYSMLAGVVLVTEKDKVIDFKKILLSFVSY